MSNEKRRRYGKPEHDTHVPRIVDRQISAPPGTLVAQADSQQSICQVIAYGPDKITELPCESMSDLRDIGKGHDVVWVNVTGLGDVEFLQELGETFGLHSLSLEDALNTHQRAKVEWFDDYLYVVVRMPISADAVATEQVSIFWTGKFVITLQEKAGDCLKAVRERIRRKVGRIRERKSQYLAYAIVDSVVDHYFPVLDHLAEELEVLDGTLSSISSNEVIHRLHELRGELRQLHRTLRPHRNMLGAIIRNESEAFDAETLRYFRDCYDHVLHLGELTETHRELCSDLREFHFSAVGTRTNEVMKTLTIISTIFIPLGFIAGLYGMNFENMPELKFQYGYFLVIGLMVVVAGGLLGWFWRRGWFKN